MTKSELKGYARTCKTRTPYYIPILSWFPKYDIKENLSALAASPAASDAF